jgi:hypothetical protein
MQKILSFLTSYKEFGDNLIQLRGDTAFIDWSREIEIYKANRGVE